MRKTAAKVLEAVTTKTTRRKRAPITQAAPVIETPVVETPSEAPVSETRVAPVVTHEMIAARAYQLFVARGGGDGRAHEDWTRAERELSLTAR